MDVHLNMDGHFILGSREIFSVFESKSKYIKGTLGQNVRNDLRKNVLKEVSLLFFKIQLCTRIMVCVPQVLLQPKASLS